MAKDPKDPSRIHGNEDWGNEDWDLGCRSKDSDPRNAARLENP
jgi:hypothetical protein